ncbi:MAG: hypothetical protein K6F25_09340 [Bacteroidales bacterium]|nr:hypothetical protein [Bacteroidales bacterium]
MAKTPCDQLPDYIAFLASRSHGWLPGITFFARDSDKNARIGARNTAIREHLRLKRARNGAQTVIWDRFCRKHAKNGCWRGIRECLEENQSPDNYNTSRNAVLLIVTVSVLS